MRIFRPLMQMQLQRTCLFKDLKIDVSDINNACT